MNCEKCGKEILDNSNHCDECSQKKKRRTLAHIGATLLSILLALLLIATTCLIVIRDAVSSSTIEEMMNNVNLDEVKIEDVADKELLESYGLVCESDNVFDIIYDNIDQEELPTPISKDEFRSIIEDEQFREYFGEIFSGSIEALTSGNSSDVVTPENIIDCLEVNREKFSSVLGYDLTEERLDHLQTTLEEDYGEVFEAIGDQKLDTLVGENVASTINFVFADWLFATLIVSVIILCGLIFLVLRSLSSGVKYCSIPFIVVGVVFLCASVAILNGLLSSLVAAPLMYIINQLTSVVLWCAVVTSIILIVIGVSAIIAVKIISRYKKRNAA